MQKSVAHHGQSICKGVTMPNQQENLDDIIINSSKKLNLKKLLLAIAVLLLVLIIIILVTKSLVQPEEKKMTSVILPPEPIDKPVMNKREEPLFEDIPIPIEDEKKDTKIDEVIGKIKKKATKQEEPIYDEISIPVDEEEEKKEPVYSKPISKNIEQPKPKPVPKPVPKQKKFTHGNYYIQVGAFFNYPPDKKFLNSIKKENLSYEIITATKNGKTYKKVIVGPYPSRKEAKNDLPIIKKRINQNAYITTKK